jgi:metal-dependent HD superfamily phosphatase/phosphodiesterase
LKFTKKIVTAMVLLNVIFVMAVLFLNYKDHSVSDSLIISWFAFTGTELVGMAGIKISEVKKGDKNDEI